MNQWKLLLAALLSPGLLLAAAVPDASTAVAKAAPAGDRVYIVELDDPPAARFGGVRTKSGGWKLAPTSAEARGQRRMDLKSAAVADYRRYLDDRRSGVLVDASAVLGRKPAVDAVLELAANGFITRLDAHEAAALRDLPGVRAVYPDRIYRMHTDAGPQWVGAPQVWAPAGAAAANRGEGVVVGIVDSGINWDHPAFADIGGDGYDHSNPLGRRLGLCNSGARCNDKLIGVWDFTDEGTGGRDAGGHGTHVASTAVGNVTTAVINGVTVSVEREISGVAPHANLVSYKACREDDAATEDEDEEGCTLSAILKSFDQAIADGVDVVNFSVGGDPVDPWAGFGMPDKILNVRAAGILVVTSAGNGGPGVATIGDPANAPWSLSVGNISHNRRFANAVEAMTGGNASPPGDLAGVGLTAGFGPARIVHARDFGNALCGTGTAELQSSCGAHTGSSNPFAPGTFDGEIVVCDRGTYGRIEKGFNVRAAGAGGLILANTDAEGESIVGDDHCLPGVHLGDANGDQLRDWLAAGGGDHSGIIAGQFPDIRSEHGDIVSSSSSRGPGAFVPGVMKPDLAAPGSDILGAGQSGSSSAFLSGTSMASPHVAGAAALLLSANPGMTPDQLHSVLMSTSLNEGMRDSDASSPADAYAVGAGRLRVDRAINAGLYLPVTTSQFRAADPASGGNPATLNLPGLVDEKCDERCSFVRRVSALPGISGQWQANVEAPAGVVVTVSPASFQLSAGQTRELIIDIDISDSADLLGSRIEGAVVLSHQDAGVTATRLPFSILAETGQLPEQLIIDTEQSSGSQMMSLSGLPALPEAEYATRGLGLLQSSQRPLFQDPSQDDPYDSIATGVMFQTVTLEADGGLIYADTVPANNGDLDLFVGRDSDGNGRPNVNEQLCASTSPDSVESCLLQDAQAGSYWVLVQNWAASTPGARDDVQIRYTAIEADARALTATGPAVLAAGSDIPVRLIWDEGRMLPGETWFGILQPKAVRGAEQGVLGNIGIEINRSGPIASGTASSPDLGLKTAFALVDDEAASFTLGVGEGHGRLFIDVPAGASRLIASTASEGNVNLQLVHEPFRFASPDVPLVSGTPIAVEDGPGGNHSITVDNPEVGRYYLVPVNGQSFAPVTFDIEARIEHQANTLRPTPGLWFNPARNGAGINLNTTADQLIIQWYTYLEDGTPTWYLAQGPFPISGNQWSADLLYFSWNGSAAEPVVVGRAMLTLMDSDEMVFSFRVNGESGSEPYQVIVPDPGCDGQGRGAERTGLWFLPALPGFGYSVLGLVDSQVHINYLYDSRGFPRWVLGQDIVASADTLPMSQFQGFCPSCAFAPVQSEVVGSNEFIFDDDRAGSIITEVQFVDAVPGQWMQSGDLANLTPTFQCAGG